MIPDFNSRGAGGWDMKLDYKAPFASAGSDLGWMVRTMGMRCRRSRWESWARKLETGAS